MQFQKRVQHMLRLPLCVYFLLIRRWSCSDESICRYPRCGHISTQKEMTSDNHSSRQDWFIIENAGSHCCVVSNFQIGLKFSLPLFVLGGWLSACSCHSSVFSLPSLCGLAALLAGCFFTVVTGCHDWFPLTYFHCDHNVSFTEKSSELSFLSSFSLLFKMYLQMLDLIWLTLLRNHALHAVGWLFRQCSEQFVIKWTRRRCQKWLCWQ